MALSLASFQKKRIVRAPRMLLVGKRKVGKTSFACGCSFDEHGNVKEEGLNNPVLLQLKGEEGADDINVTKSPKLETLEEVLEALGVLCKEDHEFGTVVIDSATTLEQLIWEYLARVHSVTSIADVDGGYGNGYVKAAETLGIVLQTLDWLREHKGMASVLIAHTKIKRFDDPDGPSYDKYQTDLHDRCAHMLERWCDVILFATRKTTVKQEDKGFGKTKGRGVDITGGKRFLRTDERPAHPGGGRGVYGRLPAELPLDYEAFMSAVADAMDKAPSGGEG